MIIDAPITHHARARGTHPAIVHGDRIMTYRELDAAVDRTAAYLLSLVDRPAGRVGLGLADTIEHLVVVLAISRSGLTLLPLDYRWSAQEQERVAAHFGASVVLLEDGQEPLPNVPSVVVDDTWHQAVAATPVGAEFPQGDGPFVISLSSGTTGRPKGPLLKHSQFRSRVMVYWANLGFHTQDTYLSCTPLYFGGGRGFSLGMLHTGGTVVLFPPPYKPEDLVAEVARSRSTIAFLVPTILRRVLALGSEASSMRGLRLLISSGSALHPTERRRLREQVCAGFMQYYASTEGGAVAFLTGDEPDRYDESVGRPVFGVDVECVDTDDRAVPAGEVGRIRYRGPAVAEEFLNDPEASKDAFVDGWYYPGDLGTFDDEGYLYIKGRVKDMIIRGGVNIYPGDVEGRLMEHGDVVDCAVVGWPCEEFNEEVAAFVVTSGQVGEDELRAFCREGLAPYKVPRGFFFLDAGLPKNGSGKVLKQSLRSRLPVIPMGERGRAGTVSEKGPA